MYIHTGYSIKLILHPRLKSYNVKSLHIRLVSDSLKLKSNIATWEIIYPINRHFSLSFGERRQGPFLPLKQHLNLQVLL